jgi:hypothetical protein
MAISKSTRSAPVGTRSSRSRRLRSPHPQGPVVNGSHGVSALSAEQFRRLTLVIPRLRAIYGTAVTAELALRQQAAEQDPELADCLRVGVCDPIADQMRELEDLIQGLRSAIPDGRP